MKYLKYFLALIAVLGLLFIGKGVLTPSVNYDVEITVDKSTEESWAVMSDEANLPKWIKGYLRSEQISGTPNTVGAKSKVFVEDNGNEMEMIETITSIEPNKIMAMSFTMDMMDMDYKMHFSEKDGKTVIRTESITTGNGMISKSMISLIQSAMKDQEVENLNNLKKLINENTKNYFPQPVVEMQEES